MVISIVDELLGKHQRYRNEREFQTTKSPEDYLTRKNNENLKRWRKKFYSLPFTQENSND